MDQTNDGETQADLRCSTETQSSLYYSDYDMKLKKEK